MSTPIFDSLMAESDDTTRALVEKALLVREFTNYLESIDATARKSSEQVRAEGLLGGAW